MSEAEMIGGIAASMNKASRALETTHDYRQVKRSNPSDTAGAEAARARAQATTPTEPAPR